PDAIKLPDDGKLCQTGTTPPTKVDTQAAAAAMRRRDAIREAKQRNAPPAPLPTWRLEKTDWREWDRKLPRTDRPRNILGEWRGMSQTAPVLSPISRHISEGDTDSTQNSMELSTYPLG